MADVKIVERLKMFAGHDRGIVISQHGSEGFSERPMTPGELAAREPAMTIAADIYRHANQAGVCYYELWAMIAAIVDQEREECAKLCEEVVTFPPGHGGQFEGYGPVKTTRSGKACATAIRAGETFHQAKLPK